MLVMPSNIELENRMLDLRDHLAVLGEQNLAIAERSDLVELNFTRWMDPIRVIRRLAEAFAQEREDELPDGIAQGVREQLAQTAGAVNLMCDFSTEQPNAHNVRQQIGSTVDQARQAFVSTFRPHLRGAAVEYSDMVERLDDALSRANTMIQDVRELKVTADELVQRTQTLAGEMAAGSLSSYYDTQATKHQKASNVFLVSAAVTGVLLAIVAAFLFLSIKERPTAEWTAYLRDLGVRVFVLGLGLYAVGFMVKGYRANQHLRVVNEHKGNALKTFRLFQESVTDQPATRDLITAELVKAVFAADQTGFLDNGPDRTVIEGQSGILSILAARSQS